MNVHAPVKIDLFAWWKAALKGERGPIHDGEPEQGFYRHRTKNKQTGVETLYAVAFWYAGDIRTPENIRCQVGGQILKGEQLQRTIGAWPFISKEPISHKTWMAVVAGQPWPDQHVTEKAAPASEASNQPLDAGATSQGAGAADQSELTPQARLKVEIEKAKAGLANYVKRGEDGRAVNLIDSDEKAGAAQMLRSSLLALSNKAKKAREEANRPHNEAIRANGLIWSPMETEAKSFADMLRDGPMKTWELHKREQQAAAQKATQAATNAVGAPMQVASNAPAPSAKIKGATGRSARVEETFIAVIHDQALVYEHFKDNEQVKAILQGLANAAVRAGIEVPGVTKEKDVNIK